MAGGKASRFMGKVEKALLEVGGRCLLERARDALEDGGVEDICVAVTKRTPRTTALARDLGLETALTAGRGYHEDVAELLGQERAFVTLNVDIPFARGEHVRSLLARKEEGSVTTVVPANLALQPPSEDAVMVDPEGARMIWVGLNIVTPAERIRLLVVEDPLLTVNINSEADLVLANRLAREHGR